jgi:hypothetical protein
MVDRILSRTVWPIGLLVAGVLVEGSLLGVGIDDLDEGYFLEQARRVLHGQVPYRDFETLYTPGLAYLHAGVLALQAGALGLLGALQPEPAAPLESPLLGPRLLAWLARGALVLVLFAMTRPLVRNPWWAMLPGLVLLLGLDDAPERWEPHPGWLSSLFAVAAAWCLTRVRPARGRLHPPPSALKYDGGGVTASVKSGVTQPLARVLSRRSTSTWIAEPEASFWLGASGLAVAGAYVFKQNTGVFMLGAILVWCFWSGWRWDLPLSAFAVATLLWLVPLVLALQGNFESLGVIFGAVSQAGLLSAPEPTLLIPLAAILGGLWLLRGDSHPHLRLYLLAGLALLLTEFPRMDTLHLIWATPLLLVVGAIALERVPRAVAIGCLAVTGVLLWPTLSARLTYVSLPRAQIDGVWALAQTAADVQPTLDEIRQRSQPGEPILVYPSSPLLYVLADRPNPTRFDHLNPGAANPRQIQQVIADLEGAHVGLVIISDFWEQAWGDPGANAALESWINAHYSEVARHGAYRVLVSDL